MSVGQWTPRYRRETAIADATAYSAAAGIPSRAYCAAAANEVDACALGKLKCVGVPTSGGSPATCGRCRRIANFSAVLSP